jgi:hypothetical protein
MTKYDPNDLIIHAALLQRVMGKQVSSRNFNSAMRRKFPDITPAALRGARDMARLLLAIRIAAADEKQDMEV